MELFLLVSFGVSHYKDRNVTIELFKETFKNNVTIGLFKETFKNNGKANNDKNKNLKINKSDDTFNKKQNLKTICKSHDTLNNKQNLKRNKTHGTGFFINNVANYASKKTAITLIIVYKSDNNYM